jgi:hypothetical protein
MAGQITTEDFIGVDDGQGKRTGIQSFLDNDVVSVMAVPGIAAPGVQLSLAAHCEKLIRSFSGQGIRV